METREIFEKLNYLLKAAVIIISVILGMNGMQYMNLKDSKEFSTSAKALQNQCPSVFIPIQGTIVSACTSKWFSQKKNYHAYLSIPYAEPPVGFLRFKEPLQPRPWEGIRTSLYDSVEQPSCVHLARSKVKAKLKSKAFIYILWSDVISLISFRWHEFYKNFDLGDNFEIFHQKSSCHHL